MAITKAKLIAAAEDINTSLGMDPLLPVEGKVADIREKVEEAAKEDVVASDNLQEDTWATLKELGYDIKGNDEPAAGKGKEPKAKAKKKAEPAEKKAAKAKKEPAPKKDRFVREYSVVDTIGKISVKKGNDPATIAENANALYVKNGGNDNVEQSLRVVGISMRFLVRAGFAEYLEDGNIRAV